MSFILWSQELPPVVSGAEVDPLNLQQRWFVVVGSPCFIESIYEVARVEAA